MSQEIIISLISLLGSLVGTFGGIYASSKLTIYRIEQLEKKIDQFDHINTKLGDLELHNAVQDEQIKTCKDNIIQLKLGENHGA